MDRIEKIIDNILSLEILAEEVKYLNTKSTTHWAITFDKKDSVRVHFGGLIVFTMSNKELWISVSPDLIDATNREIWTWDANGYPEYTIYKNFKILNGYVKLPLKNNWDKIRKAHFDIVNKIAQNPKKLDKRTIENQDSASFVYLDRSCNCNFPLPEYLIREEVGKIDIKDHEIIDGLGKTEKERVVKSRIGQRKFREKLIGKYGKCVLCGLENKELLRASHIKKWSDSNSSERLDVNNGFLLCSIHDSLFDSGLISFRDSGEVMLSEQIGREDREILNLEGKKISLVKENLEFLDWHRNEIFK